MKRLTKAEEEIMHMIWQHGPCTVSNLISKMDKPHPPHSTISSIVRILEKKGFVDHNTYGRTHEYFHIIAKADYSKFSLTHLVSDYFDGSMNNLVSYLVKENNLSISDLSDMINQLNNQDKKSKS